MKNNYITTKNRILLICSMLLMSFSVTAQTTNPLYLFQPTYLCNSGFIEFNTAGGDGTTITYSTTGVTLSSPDSKTGIVDAMWRNNPDSGPIVIQATQSGNTTFRREFSVRAYCSASSPFLSPILISPIPDTTFTANKPYQSIGLSDYFGSKDNGYDYRAVFAYKAYGIPPGMTFTSISGTPPPFAGQAIAFISGTPTVAGEYKVTVIATKAGFLLEPHSIADTFNIKIVDAPISLTRPDYDCPTGAITFKTSGGDGSTIEFMAIGITDWTTNPNQFVDAKTRSVDNTSPIILRARQSGKEATYLLDIRQQCPNPLRLVAPTYNCVTGAITFMASGGDGSPIEYMAIGITDWTSNANGYVDTNIRTDVNAAPITLRARQSGKEVTYLWDFRQQCHPVYPLRLVAPTYDCQSGAFAFMALDGDSSPIEFMAIGITDWTTNRFDHFVDANIRTDANAAPIILRARQSGKIVTYTWDIRQQCPVGNQDALRLVAPTYDCQSGAFTFETSGGDGSAIEYMAIGITGWTTNPNQFVDGDTRTAADAAPLNLRARQSGKIVTYIWDIRQQCPVNSENTLRLVYPVYNCQSGAFIFKTSGGDGSPIEFMAIGITAWTSNPNQFVDGDTRTAADAAPLNLRARQSGKIVTYTWDIRKQCPVGSFRLGSVPELNASLQITVLGNPVINETASIEIRGALGETVRIQTISEQGNQISETTIGNAAYIQHSTIRVGSSPGLYLIRVSTPTQYRTAKVIK